MTPDNTKRQTRRPSSRRRGAESAVLDSAGKYQRCSAEQERTALVELARLRDVRWQALRSVPAIASIIDAALQRGDDPGHADATTAAVFEMLEGDRARLLDVVAAETLAAYEQRLRDGQAAYAAHRNEFVCANLRFVVAIARRYGGQWISLADRIQEGNLGLLKAAERFDPTRGARFSTYAAWWIRHFITRALINRGRSIRIPAHLNRTYIKARKARPTLQRRLGREPTTPEVANAIGVEPERLVDATEAMELRVSALHEPLKPGSTRTAAETLVAPEPLDFDRHIDDRRHLAATASPFHELDDRAQDILTRRFGLGDAQPTTLREIGADYGLSRERIRQLQNAALHSLRRSITERRAVA